MNFGFKKTITLRQDTKNYLKKRVCRKCDATLPIGFGLRKWCNKCKKY